MTAPPRPTPAELARHCCGLGHRLVASEHWLADFVCVDCGARAHFSHDAGGLRWQWDVLPWTSQKPPCTGAARGDERRDEG
jgi:hypothetical protein